MKIYIDGKWVSKQNAKISVFDHGVLYGDGVFEGIRAYHGVVFRLKDHLDRLWRSASLISLKIPMSKEKMANIIYLGLKKNKLSDAYIRLLVTRGVGDLGLDPRVCKKPGIILIEDKLALFPRACYDEGLKAVISKVRRNIPEALDPTIKSMNYLNNILAKIEANKNDVPEAIMLNHQGYVAECSGDNVFFIHGNHIITPPISAGALEGITRKTVIEIVREETNLILKEELFTPRELLMADEVFFTGTAAEIIPVTEIDRQKIGKGLPGKQTLELIKLFKDFIAFQTA